MGVDTNRGGAACFTVSLQTLEPRRLMAASPEPTSGGGDPRVDPVGEWNDVLIAALRADRTLPGPGWSSRSGAMVHAAIFDAVNAIDGSYQPYLVDAHAPKNLPIDAAVAGAAWRVLSAIYPDQQSTFDAA